MVLSNSKKAIKEKIINLTPDRFKQGYSRLALKNGFYQTLTTISSRFGGLILTIILARMLMPELFGLYSLALGTILLFVSLADFGFNQTLVKFISQELGRDNPQKAKSYFNYIFKYKLILLSMVMVASLLLSNFLAVDYYQKPIFLSLLLGVVYIFSMSLLTFFDSVFNAANDFKVPFYKEFLSQILRIILVPIFVIFSVKLFVSQDAILATIFAALSITYLLTLLFIYFIAKKHLRFLSQKTISLNKPEKNNVNKFLLALSVTFLSGLFFGYVDIFILGRLISAEFIGYYKAAFNLVGSISGLIAFPAVLLPIFSRLSGKRLENGLNSSKKYILWLSFAFFILCILFSRSIIYYIYGSNYLDSLIFFRILLLLILVLPITSAYENYFFAKKKPMVVTKYLIISTIFMIALSYLSIVYFIKYGESMAVLSVCCVAVAIRYLYLFALMLTRK